MNSEGIAVLSIIGLVLFLILLYRIIKFIKSTIQKITRFFHGSKAFVAIDFETANERFYSACAIGIVLFVGDRPIRRAHYLINPKCDFDPDNISIHGITPDQVSHSPTFKKLWPKIESFFKLYPIVAYSDFDMKVLMSLIKHYKIRSAESFKITYIDACQLARENLPGLPNYKLPTVAEYLKITGLKHHNALSDAETCGLIYAKIGMPNKQGNHIEHSTVSLPATAAQRNYIETLGGIAAPDLTKEEASHYIDTLIKQRDERRRQDREADRRRRNLEKMLATPPRPSVTPHMRTKWMLEFQQLWNTAANTGDISRESAEDLRGWLYAHRALGMMHEDFIAALDSVIDKNEPATDSLFNYAAALVTMLGGKPRQSP